MDMFSRFFWSVLKWVSVFGIAYIIILIVFTGFLDLLVIGSILEILEFNTEFANYTIGIVAHLGIIYGLTIQFKKELE